MVVVLVVFNAAQQVSHIPALVTITCLPMLSPRKW